jgi:hypothetical protein
MRLSVLSFPWSRIIVLPLCCFAVAFVADVTTGRQFSPVLGTGAIVTSLFSIFRSARALIGSIALWATLWIGFNLLRAVADGTGVGLVPVDAIAGMEKSISSMMPSGVVQAGAADLGIASSVDWAMLLVYLSFFVTPHAMALVLLVRRRDIFWRYIIAMTGVLMTGVVAFILLPTAPPWYVDATVRRVPQEVLFSDSSGRALGFDPNGMAAFPSVHMAAVTLVGTALATFGDRWRRIGKAYAAAMAFAIVYLGEHHVVDALAGGVLALACWRAAVWAKPVLFGRSR